MRPNVAITGGNGAQRNSRPSAWRCYAEFRASTMCSKSILEVFNIFFKSLSNQPSSFFCIEISV